GKGILAGMLVGVGIVIAFTITGFHLWGMNNGIPAIVANLVVMVAVSALTGPARRPEIDSADHNTAPVGAKVPIH
ncbi:MAG: hypothetical protein L0J24_04890, partial [Corynebacterium flavescens]